MANLSELPKRIAVLRADREPQFVQFGIELKGKPVILRAS